MNQLQLYRENGFPNIQGWVAPAQLAFVDLIAKTQDAAGITGHAAEIGVYHGKFLLALASVLQSGGKVTALDVFNDQDKNLDKSGVGDKEILIRNVETYGRRDLDYAYIQADSSALTILDKVSLVRDRGPFRLFSVDGCHTAEHTLSDLQTARDCIAPGGVVILDDYMQPHWPGVTEAASIFCREAPRVVPFLFAYHKLYFVGVGWHETFLRAVTDALSEYPNARLTTMFGNRVLSIYP